MKKIILFTTIFIFTLSFVGAQNTTVRSAAVAGGSVGNSFFAIGQPVAEQWGDENVHVSEGVGQAHLLNLIIKADTCQDEGYIKHGFIYPADTAPGTYHEIRYTQAVTVGYDSLFDLTLNIHPSYHTYDTLSFYHKPEAPWVVGENIIDDITEFGCDSNLHVWVYLRPFECGDLLYDVEENTYKTLEIANTCWMQENLRSLVYDDSSTVTGNMVYQADLAPDTAANLATYGYLYTWQAAAHLSGENADSSATNDDGLVMGICPAGWHLPTAAEINDLAEYGSDALKTAELWLVPGDNSSEFSALPAGDYNAAAGRFENIFGKTHFWMSGEDNGSTAPAAELRYSCEYPLIISAQHGNGFSVRCVQDKKND